MKGHLKRNLEEEVLHRKINRSNKAEVMLNWSPWYPEPKPGCSLPQLSSTLYWRSQTRAWPAKRSSSQVKVKHLENVEKINLETFLIPYTKCYSKVHTREKVPNFTIMFLTKHFMNKRQRLGSWGKMCLRAWKLETFGQREEKGRTPRRGKPGKTT